MGKAIGMAEYKTVSAGIQAADHMVKAADIEILEAQTVCPGKYIILIRGELSTVQTAINQACEQFGGQLIDSFILGNPHESIFEAMYGVTKVKEVKALGVLETYSAAAAFVAADEAAKSAEVELIELRIARGMCGKSYMMLTGSVAAVEAGIKKAMDTISESGMLLDYSIIPNPDRKLWNTIL